MEEGYVYLQHQALALMQSLLGVISPNFRIVWVTLGDDTVVVNIVLATMSEEDLEEIGDLETEFESLRSASLECEFNVTISSESICWPDPASSIVVYRRREN